MLLLHYDDPTTILGFGVNPGLALPCSAGGSGTLAGASVAPGRLVGTPNGVWSPKPERPPYEGALLRLFFNANTPFPLTCYGWLSGDPSCLFQVALAHLRVPVSHPDDLWEPVGTGANLDPRTGGSGEEEAKGGGP